MMRRTIEDRIYDQLVAGELDKPEPTPSWVRVLPLKEEVYVCSDTIVGGDIDNLKITDEGGREYQLLYNKYNPICEDSSTKEYYLNVRDGGSQLLPLGPYRFLHEVVDKLLEDGYTIYIKLD